MYFPIRTKKANKKILFGIMVIHQHASARNMAQPSNILALSKPGHLPTGGIDQYQDQLIDVTYPCIDNPTTPLAQWGDTLNAHEDQGFCVSRHTYKYKQAAHGCCETNLHTIRLVV